MESFSEMVQNAALRSQAFLDGVNANMETALDDLFVSIDVNKDGVISKDEFSGMSLNTWAMLRSFTSCVNCLPNLPAMKEIVQSIPTDLSFQKLQESFPSFLPVSVLEEYSWFTIYVMCLVGFQLFLYLFENWRYLAGLRCSWRYPDAKSRSVRKVDKATALTYDTPLTRYEVAKMAFMTLSGMVIFRLLTALAFFVIGVVCVNISVYLHSPRWRSFWMYVCRFFTKCMFASMGYMCVNITGKISDKTKVKILIGNHCCMIEVLALYVLSGGCAFVSAVENLHIPLFKGVVEASDAILVDRNTSTSKKQTIEEVKRRAHNPNGSQLMMFPEGTLNNQQALFQYKCGPFIPGVPVQPVCFKVPYRHFNPCWTGEATGGLNIQDVTWRTFCQFVNRLEVTILPVHIPSDEETQDPELYANNIRNDMARTLDLPVCDATYADYLECQTKYALALSKSKQDKGRFNFANVHAEMRTQSAATLKLVEQHLKEESTRISAGPLAFQKSHPKGLLSNYENSEGGYITRDGVGKLACYKYQGGAYSLVDNLMNPMWTRAAQMLPICISPNAVTLTGFFGFVCGLSIIFQDAWYSDTPELAATGNVWVQLSAAFFMWFYQTMDAMDGKHARNTGQSSPLGALFDHGCDACAMVLGALCIELSTSHPSDRATNQRLPHLLAFILPLSAFYVAQWEHYHVGVLPTAGVTETQIICFFIVAAAGFDRMLVYRKCGDFVTFLSGDFAEWTVLQLSEIAIVAIVLMKIVGSIRQVVSKTESLAPIGTLLPFLLHHVQIFLLAFSPCYASHRIICLVVIGLNFADLTLRMIISGLCGIKYPFIHWPTVPFTLVSCWVFAPNIVPLSFDCTAVLICTSVWQVMSVLWLASDTIARICSCLNIPFLAAKPNMVKKVA